MDSTILLILFQDGIVNGAIYALLALSLVLVFAVTRVIFIPQGEFVTFGALTLAALEAGQLPGTAWFVLGLGSMAALVGAVTERHTLSRRGWVLLALETIVLPAVLVAATSVLAPLKPGLAVQSVLALALVTPMGAYIHRIAFQPLQRASVLTLLIAAVGVHLVMTGLGLILFGAEGSRTSPLSTLSFAVGPLAVTGQSLAIVAATFVLMGGFYVFFGRTLLGKALRATAINRLGAQLSGIPPAFAGRVAFTMAAFVGALSGILIGAITTIYYDTGFLIGLKGFVAAIAGGLASYPLAAASAIFVGLVEAFASFWSSAFKEVIVFSLIIPVLLWRSARAPSVDDEGEADDQGAAVGQAAGRPGMGRALAVLAVVLAAALPLLPGIPVFWITLLDYIGMAALVSIGLVVLTGAAGITSFGQAMFVGLGAYTTGVLTLNGGLSPWLSLPLALALTAAVAWGIGAITLRLSGHYLPVATIAWNVSFFYIAANLDAVGRNDGLSGLPPVTIFGISLLGSGDVYYLIWACVAMAAILTGNLLHSRVGRAVRALKGGVIAAESFGINAGRMKTLAFVYAGTLAALSGWLYAHVQRAMNPTPFSLNASIEYLLIQVPPDGLWRRLISLRATRSASGSRGGLHSAPARGGGHSSAVSGGNAASLFSVRHLKKTFGGLVAVDDVTFDVQPREILGLIGPNGAGKSTTFNVATGVLSATTGEILLEGLSIDRLLPRQIAERGVARTFQHVKLAGNMTVIENVALGAHLRGQANAIAAMTRFDRREEKRLLAEASHQLDRVGLSNLALRPALTLALGQQRLVEIARALCLNPKLLLLDEPAAGLRHHEKAALSALLLELKAEGLGILLVEHDMDFVMGLADRLVVMNFGKMLAEGTPAQIRANEAVVEAYLGVAA